MSTTRENPSSIVVLLHIVLVSDLIIIRKLNGFLRIVKLLRVENFIPLVINR